VASSGGAERSGFLQSCAATILRVTFIMCGVCIWQQRVGNTNEFRGRRQKTTAGDMRRQRAAVSYKGRQKAKRESDRTETRRHFVPMVVDTGNGRKQTINILHR
jgi:hypothetical protein